MLFFHNQQKTKNETETSISLNKLRQVKKTRNGLRENKNQNFHDCLYERDEIASETDVSHVES